MTEQTTMPDWVLIEAAKRSGGTLPVEQLRAEYNHVDGTIFRALCDMILKHEQPPVDRKVLCAREAADRWWNRGIVEEACVRAIDLYLEGFGQ